MKYNAAADPCVLFLITVEELYRLLASNNVRVRTEDMVQVEDLHEHKDLYRAQVKNAKEFVESKMSEMNTVLDGNIARLNEQVVNNVG